MRTPKPRRDQGRGLGERISWGPLSGYSVLIVEDEPLIALDVHAALSTSGASLIAATRLAEARELIRRAEVSAAILDINLDGADCGPLCQALSAQRIPFMFYTGNPAADITRSWPSVPVLNKPAPAELIVERVAKLLRSPIRQSRAPHNWWEP
jgi:DNA-binding response OmpR family regulator